MIAQNHHKRIVQKNRKSFFIGGVFSLIVLFSFYIILLNGTVRNVVRAEDAQKAVSLLSSEIGELESTYLSLVRTTLTLEKASEFGLIHSNTPPEYISRTKSAAFLSPAVSESQRTGLFTEASSGAASNSSFNGI